MERKQGLIGGLLGQKGEDGSEGHDDSSGKAGGSDAGGSPPKGKRVDAYEEDWYRSLKALAERRAQMAEEDDEEAPAASEPSDEPPSDQEPPAEEELEQLAAEIGEPPAEVLEPDAAAPEPSEHPAAAAPEPSDQPVATELEAVEAPQPEDPDSPEPVEPVRAQAAEPVEAVEAIEAVEAAHAVEVVASSEAEMVPIEAQAAAPEAEPESEPEPEPAEASLNARDPEQRRLALRELAERGLGDGELEQVVGLVLDPDQQVRRLALEVLSTRADRVDDATIRQALMDPADQVRATAVRLAAERGSRDLVLLAPLVAARRWPLTQAAALDLLPELLASTSTIGETELDLLLTSIGEMDSPPTMEEGPSIARLSRDAAISRLVRSLSLPEVRRLGAVRNLVEGEEAPEILRALATLVSDPLDEIREVAEVAADAIGRTDDPIGGSEFFEDAPLAPAEAERIASLARSLRDADEAVRHLARSGLGGVERNRVLAWAREAMHTGDLDTASAAAETVHALRLYEIGVDILNRAIELPLEAREPFLKALARVRLEDLVGLLGQVDESRKPEAIRVLWNSSGPPVL